MAMRQIHPGTRWPMAGLGLTLVELLVALATLSILTAIALPSFQYVTERNRLAVSANRLQSALSSARITAVTRNMPVTFCAGNAVDGCHGAWDRQEWIIFTDRDHDAVIDEGDELLVADRLLPSERISLAGNGPFKTAVIFNGRGGARTRTGAFAAGRLRVCVRYGLSPNATDLVLIGSGRAEPERHGFHGTCPAP